MTDLQAPRISKAAELEDLYREYADGGTMQISTYHRREAEILARPDPKPVVPMAVEYHTRQGQLEQIARLCGAGDERYIEGIASSPSANSHGYAVDPLACKVELPIPLVLEHDTRRRVGWVIEATKTLSSVTFTARVANASASFPEADAAWGAIVDGKLACVSTGFPQGGIGDWRTNRLDVDRVAHAWTWSELSLCETGANPDAKILLVRELRGVHEYVLRNARPKLRVVRL